MSKRGHGCHLSHIVGEGSPESESQGTRPDFLTLAVFVVTGLDVVSRFLTAGFKSEYFYLGN